MILGGKKSVHQTFVQAAGNGTYLRADDLRHAIAASNSLHHTLLRFAQKFLEQVSETAVVNGRNSVAPRLARWLLMAADRLENQELPFTHEFVGMMLCVRRAGVTQAVRELEKEGLVKLRRSHIRILDRKGVEEKASRLGR